MNNKMIENISIILFFWKYETLAAKLPNNPLSQQHKKELFTLLSFLQKRDEIHINLF